MKPPARMSYEDCARAASRAAGRARRALRADAARAETRASRSIYRGAEVSRLLSDWFEFGGLCFS